MKTISSLKFALLLGASALLSSLSGYAQIEYHVTINTSSLTSPDLSSNAPFALDFQLNYGDGLSQSAAINNFNFGTGGSAGSLIGTVNNASGSLSSEVDLSAGPGANSARNEFTQVFTPGSTLSFNLYLSSNASAATPSDLVLSIFEGPGSNISDLLPIPTTQGDVDGDALATFQILGESVSPNHRILVTPYAGINNPSEGGDFSGVTVNIQAIPEPSIWATLGLGMIGLLFLQFRRRRA